MPTKTTQMRVTIASTDENEPEELATATQQLRNAILETDVHSAELVSSGEAPKGARVADPVTLGALLIAFGASGGVFAKLIDTINDWVGKGDKRSVTLEIAGDKLTMTGVSKVEEKQLIDDWVARHNKA